MLKPNPDGHAPAAAGTGVPDGPRGVCAAAALAPGAGQALGGPLLTGGMLCASRVQATTAWQASIKRAVGSVYAWAWTTVPACQPLAPGRRWQCEQQAICDAGPRSRFWRVVCHLAGAGQAFSGPLLPQGLVPAHMALLPGVRWESAWQAPDLISWCGPWVWMHVIAI